MKKFLKMIISSDRASAKAYAENEREYYRSFLKDKPDKNKKISEIDTQF
jgi:hypothetical protein